MTAPTKTSGRIRMATVLTGSGSSWGRGGGAGIFAGVMGVAGMVAFPGVRMGVRGRDESTDIEGAGDAKPLAGVDKT